MIKIGFVGYGYWGKNVLRNLMAMKDIRVKAICDKNEENLNEAMEQYPKIPLPTTNFDDLIKNKGIDALVLATTPETHHWMVKKALEADKHVFVEKPFVTSSKDANELVYLAKQHNRVICVGHTFVYNPAINDIKTLITDGELGKIHYIDFTMTNLGKYQKYNVLWDLAPHGVSIILHLLEGYRVYRVEVNGIDAIKKGLLDVAYLTIYLWDDEGNRVLANIHFSWLNPNKERRLTVVGSKKMVVFDDISPLEKLRIYDKGISSSKTNFSSWGESIVGYRHGNIIIPTTTAGEPLKIELQDFIASIVYQSKPVSDGEMGLRVTEVIEKANEKLNNE